MSDEPVIDDEVLGRLEARARTNLSRRSSKGVDVSPRLLLALIAKARLAPVGDKEDGDG